jgi:formylglycine-generating enzyme required for sulfatase activity
MRTETRLPTPSLSRLIQHTLLLCLALALPTTWAQKRVALLVGNGQYQHESVLANPVNDVRLLANVLRGAPLNFKVEVLENQDRREMDLAIKRFVRESTGADTALLYYAGHGAQPTKGGRSYLLPVNAKAVDDDSLEADGILAESIASQLEQQAIPAKLRLVVLDACRNTRLTSSSRSSVRGLAPPARTDSYTLIAYSTDANSVAQDGVGGVNSPYAKALAQHLPRVAQEPVRVIFEDTAKDVRTATRQAQAPRTYGDLESRVGLDGLQVASLRAEPEPPAPGPSAAQIEAQAWTAAQRGNTTGVYNAYLREYPDGSYAGAARVALASLEPARPVQNTQPPSAGQVVKDCDVCPELVVIPGGSFTMGSSAAEQALAKDGGVPDAVLRRESPQHTVSVRSFAAGKYAVTKGQFAAFVRAKGYQTEAEAGDGCYGLTDSGWKKDKAYTWRNVGFVQGDDHPVVCVSWNDTQAYIQWLNQTSGKTYRLLSEAEREYAARAGSQTAYWWGETINTAQANYDGTGKSYNNSAEGEWRKSTVPVSSFRANPFGLYSVHGNVWEWVEDCFHANYSGAPSDGSAWTTGCRGNSRVLRGGSWGLDSAYLRSAIRYGITSDLRDNLIGFRIARTLLTP